MTTPATPPADLRRSATFLLAVETAVRASGSFEHLGQAMLLYLLPGAGVSPLLGGAVLLSLVGLTGRTGARFWALGPGLRHAQGPALAVAVAVALGVWVVGAVVGAVAQYVWGQGLAAHQGGGSLMSFMAVWSGVRMGMNAVEWFTMAGLLGYGLLSTRSEGRSD